MSSDTFEEAQKYCNEYSSSWSSFDELESCVGFTTTSKATKRSRPTNMRGDPVVSDADFEDDSDIG